MKHGSISLRCALLGMSRDTFYQYPKRKACQQERDAPIVQELHRLETADKNPKKHYRLGIKGLKMVYDIAHRETDGKRIGKNKVQRLMRTYNIMCHIRQRRRKKPQQPKPEAHMVIPPNRLLRDFNTVRTALCIVGTDVTYIWCPQLNRFAYLSLARDFVTGEFIGHSVSLHNDQALVDATILNIEARFGSDVFIGMFTHTDQGATYTTKHYQYDMLESRGVIPSMSAKGKCLDNAPTESGNGHIKDWIDVSTCTTFAEVVAEIDSVVHFFNEERPQWHRKKMTPVQYRNHLLATA